MCFISRKKKGINIKCYELQKCQSQKSSKTSEKEAQVEERERRAERGKERGREVVERILHGKTVQRKWKLQVLSDRIIYKLKKREKNLKNICEKHARRAGEKGDGRVWAGVKLGIYKNLIEWPHCSKISHKLTKGKVERKLYEWDAPIKAAKSKRE